MEIYALVPIDRPMHVWNKPFAPPCWLVTHPSRSDCGNACLGANRLSNQSTLMQDLCQPLCRPGTCTLTFHSHQSHHLQVTINHSIPPGIPHNPGPSPFPPPGAANPKCW